MNHWSMEISKVDNGYLCETYEDDEEGTGRQLSGVFVVEEGDDGEHETMQRLLWRVMEYFGVYSSKHNDINCQVVLEKTGKKFK